MWWIPSPLGKVSLKPLRASTQEEKKPQKHQLLVTSNYFGMLIGSKMFKKLERNFWAELKIIGGIQVRRP